MLPSLLFLSLRVRPLLIINQHQLCIQGSYALRRKVTKTKSITQNFFIDKTVERKDAKSDLINNRRSFLNHLLLNEASLPSPPVVPGVQAPQPPALPAPHAVRREHLPGPAPAAPHRLGVGADAGLRRAVQLLHRAALAHHARRAPAPALLQAGHQAPRWGQHQGSRRVTFRCGLR